MTSKAKDRASWILVVASMILLFLFVGYWNVSSYSREKNKLADDVQIQLQLAYTEIKDSELVYFIKTHLSGVKDGKDILDSISIFFHSDREINASQIEFSNAVDTNLDSIALFVETGKTIPSSHIDFHNELATNQELNPLKKDSAIIIGLEIDTTLISAFENDTCYQNGEFAFITTSKFKSTTRTKEVEANQETPKPIFDIKGIEINNDNGPSGYRYQWNKDSSRTMTMIESEDSFPVRLELLATNADSISNSPRFFDFGEDRRHTSVDKTYALFKTKLEENHLPNTFEVISRPNQALKGMKVTYTASGLAIKDWSIDLQQYTIYILKKMLPTLLFSLLLLGIITLAFWTLIRNWTRQNRLVLVKNEFINNMTHELKTPIATVGVALEAISNFDLSQEQEKTKEYLEMSRSEINRLSILVDKVLTIAAFDATKAPMSLENVILEKIINDNIHAVQFPLQSAGGTLNFSNHTHNSMVKGDEVHLSNVIHNMIDNAIKYCQEKPEIEITLEEATSNYLITIKDNGLGIPKEYQDKIFDRFFRVPTNDTHDVKGHGLGLNYAQNVIEGHGGKIDVKSKENQGTTFIISLPKSNSDV
ncbi:MAG: HAMP domain-containing sensor histidine kinase [Bacteroidota bacterium]